MKKILFLSLLFWGYIITLYSQDIPEPPKGGDYASIMNARQINQYRIENKDTIEALILLYDEVGHLTDSILMHNWEKNTLDTTEHFKYFFSKKGDLISSKVILHPTSVFFYEECYEKLKEEGLSEKEILVNGKLELDFFKLNLLNQAVFGFSGKTYTIAPTLVPNSSIIAFPYPTTPVKMRMNGTYYLEPGDEYVVSSSHFENSNYYSSPHFEKGTKTLIKSKDYEGKEHEEVIISSRDGRIISHLDNYGFRTENFYFKGYAPGIPLMIHRRIRSFKDGIHYQIKEETTYHWRYVKEINLTIIDKVVIVGNYTTTYFYDDQSRLTEVEILIRNNKTGDYIPSTNKYIYGSKGELLKIQGYQDGKPTEYYTVFEYK